MRKVTYGIAIIHSSGKILLGHSTGNHHWDIFKGGADEDETPWETAIRETQEECGLLIARSQLHDCGEFAYNKEKNLHLFIYVAPTLIDLALLHCDSCFETTSGRRLPEMDLFAWFDLTDDQLNKVCTKNMAAALSSQLATFTKRT